MTNAAWNSPGLGFDPLPGDPEVVRSLQDDARIFGQRMTDEAKRLRRLAHRDAWQGEAADVFAQHLETLPRDLQRCGDAFSDLALALGNYHHAFTMAKAKAADLERRAVEARQKVQAAQVVIQAPPTAVIQPADARPPPPGPSPLETAEDELGAILREAHEFAEHFNDSPEVQQIAAAIRSFTEFAPDEPRWNVIRRWAGDAFRLTPVGAALNATHELINQFAEFFNDLAGLLSDLSTSLGILTLPLMFVPPLGTTMAVGALAAAAGSAALKTSLYVGHARDANGNLYVSGGNLIRSYVDVGVNAVGIAGAAGATRAVKLADGATRAEASFGKSLAEQFSAKTFREAGKAPGKLLKFQEEFGTKATAKFYARQTARQFAVGQAGRAYNIGGVFLTGAGPMLTATESWNVAGWRAPVHLLQDDVPALFSDAPNTPDLEVNVPAVMTEAGAEPTPVMRPREPSVQPVMRREPHGG